MKNQPSFAAEPRLISPDDLIGSTEASQILGVNRATIVRRANSGQLPCIARLDGANGALVFDRHDVEANK